MITNCHVQERTCSKVYVAKVQGRFPSTVSELRCTAQGGDLHVKAVQQTDDTTYTPLSEQPVFNSNDHDQNVQQSPNGAGQSSQVGRQVEVQEGTGQVDEAGGNLLIQVEVHLAWSPKSNHATAVPVGSQVPSLLQLPGTSIAMCFRIPSAWLCFRLCTGLNALVDCLFESELLHGEKLSIPYCTPR